MTTTTNTPTTTKLATKPSIGSIIRAGAIGIVIATVINVILYLISTTIGALPAMATMGQPITLVPVLTFTIGGGIAATIGYLILTRFLTHGRANTVFVIIASLVIIGMAFTPITSVVEPTVMTVVMLEIMHLAAALPPMFTLTKQTRP